MDNLVTYKFSNLDDGHGNLYDGLADIGWLYERPDPLMGGGYSFWVSCICINLPDKRCLNIDESDDRYKKIRSSLFHHHSQPILQLIEDDKDSNEE